MTVEWKTNFDPKKLATDLMDRQEKALDRALQEAARGIVQRTQQGRDVSGSTFDPYSPKYKEWKRKKGRTGDVDLTFSGKMLQSIQSKIKRTTSAIIGTIYFNGSKEAAKARGNLRYREFFGLSTKQVDEISKALTEARNG